MGTLSLGGGYSQTTGDKNVAIGASSLFSLQYGDENLAVGPSVASTLTAGRYNIFLGTRTGYNLRAGNDNIMIGNADYGDVGTRVSNTVRIGATSSGNIDLAGLARLDRVGNNIILGESAGDSLPKTPQLAPLYNPSSDLISNGDGSTTTDWTLVGGTNYSSVSVSSLTSGTNNETYLQFSQGSTMGGTPVSSYIWQAITTQIGKRYTVTATFRHTPSTSLYPLGRIYVNNTTHGQGLSNRIAISGTSASSSNPHHKSELYVTFTADSTTTYISLVSEASGINQWSNIGAVRIGTDNVLMGTLAGEDMLYGSSNVAIGYQAGENVTSGEQNILIGDNAGSGTTDGSNNILIGTSVNTPYQSVGGWVAIGNAVTNSARINTLQPLTLRYSSSISPSAITTYGDQTIITSTGYAPNNVPHKITVSTFNSSGKTINTKLWRRIGTGTYSLLGQMETLSTDTDNAKSYVMFEYVSGSTDVQYKVTARADQTPASFSSNYKLMIEKIG
jgi:trimeric autotransporter adhesin